MQQQKKKQIFLYLAGSMMHKWYDFVWLIECISQNVFPFVEYFII